ncbi:MAG: aromatic ring-hydroxylating dioxygenase subunit alpha [Actinomycetota bacterium]
MRREMELALGDRLVDLLERGPRPAEHPFTSLDPAAYTSLEIHRDEVAAIAAGPVAALASSELAAPGDFITVELGGVPIIISRDREGRVHAMRNVCAHRGATVETREAGSARIFSCGFHSWSYDLDGSLRNVTDSGIWSSEPCTTGLRRLACEERHGIVWVTPDAESGETGETVAEWLGDEVDELLAELGLAAMVHHATVDYDLHCNWKLLTDGFLEIYHLKYLHRDSIAPYFPANTTATSPTGDHFVGWLPKNRLVKELTERPREEWEVLRHLTGAIVLVPGTVVQWQAGHVELFSLRPHPTDPTRTTARLTMLVPAERADETDLWDRNWERVNVTIPDEDFAAAVDVQRNIDAGAVDEIRLGANEHFLADHLAAVRRRSELVNRRSRDLPVAVG